MMHVQSENPGVYIKIEPVITSFRFKSIEKTRFGWGMKPHSAPRKKGYLGIEYVLTFQTRDNPAQVANSVNPGLDGSRIQ
jgi:hypothetical protein